MQTTSDLFTTLAQSSMRPLKWDARISFEKDFDDDITFFTIGDSLIGGTDFIKGTGDIVQEWDKYTYTDVSDRVIDVEWTRQTERFASVTLAMADIVFDNYDDYFTPQSDSEIADFILPARPIRISAGFGDEAIPQFIGITEGMPVIDEKAKTATFHCIDFLYSLFNRKLTESALLFSNRTDEILVAIFELAGLTAAQVSFDEGLVTIPYYFAKKDTRLYEAVKKLMEVEQGRVYMDENGVIVFKNRQNYSSTSVYDFNSYDNIYDLKTKTVDEILNVAEIIGAVREEQPNQPFYEITSTSTNDPTALLVPAGDTKEIWAELSNPVVTIDDPVYIDDVVTSSFTVNTEPDGSGSASTDVSLQSSDLLSGNSVFKMTFENAGVADLYITRIELYATPIIIKEPIYIREELENSVATYEERIVRIENDLFQNKTEAQTKALTIVNDYGNFGGVSQMDVKGNMALQLDDPIEVNSFGRVEDYKIAKITNKFSIPAKFTQILTLRKFTPFTYFTIGVSLIGGDDLISP